MAWYDKWAIMVITAAVGLAGYESIPWCKMDITIWAYWVAAVGTTGTLIGTIWLATNETRTKNARELVVARISASALRPRVLEVENICKNVCKMLNEISKEVTFEEFSLNKIRKVGVSLGTVETWDTSDLMPLAALRGGCAEKLAGAHGFIATVASLLKNTRAGNGNADATAKFVISNMVLLEYAIKLMRSACNEMQNATITNPFDVE
jgi:hypothetical protein